MGKKIISDCEILYYMKYDKVCTKILVQGNKVEFENYSDFWLDKAFGDKEDITLDDLEDFFSERCFPKERANCKEVLNALGVDFYNPYEIVKKTHGVMCHDHYWVKFEGEEIDYEEARKSVGL